MNKRTMSWGFGAFVWVLGIGAQGTASAAGPTAREILEHSETATRFPDVQSQITMTTGGASEAPKTKSFTMWRRVQSDGVRYQTLARFHAPAEVRNEGILFVENANHDNQVLLYLPSFKKTRRVEGQAQSGSFMGSTFSYSDIATPHAGDWKSTILRTEPCPADGGTCSVLELIPASDGVKERTGYSKQISWIRNDNFVQVQFEAFDKNGALWKRSRATSVRELDAAHHRWFAHEVRIEDVRTKRQTVLKYDGVRVNGGIPESTFTRQNLEKAD